MAGQPVHSSTALITAHTIGSAFIAEYYDRLHRHPETVIGFYKPPDGGPSADLMAAVDSEINQRLMALDYRNFKTRIIGVKSQESSMGGVLVTVSGLLCNKLNADRRQFIQSFLLSPQTNAQQKNKILKYFVRNDILWFTDEYQYETQIGYEYRSAVHDRPLVMTEEESSSNSSTQHEVLESMPATFKAGVEPTIQDDNEVIEAEDVPNGLQESSQVRSTPATGESPVKPEEASVASPGVSSLVMPEDKTSKDQDASKPSAMAAPKLSPVTGPSPFVPTEETSNELTTTKPSPLAAPSSDLFESVNTSKEAPKSSPVTAPSPFVRTVETSLKAPIATKLSPLAAPSAVLSESVDTSKEAPKSSPVTAPSPVVLTEETSNEPIATKPSPVAAPSPIPLEGTLTAAPKKSYATIVSSIPFEEIKEKEVVTFSYTRHSTSPEVTKAPVFRRAWNSSRPISVGTRLGALKKEVSHPLSATPPDGKQALNSSHPTSAATDQGEVWKEGTRPNVGASADGKQASNSSRPTSAVTGKDAGKKEGSRPNVTAPPIHPQPSNSSERHTFVATEQRALLEKKAPSPSLTASQVHHQRSDSFCTKCAAAATRGTAAARGRQEGWFEKSVYIRDLPSHIRHFDLRAALSKFGAIKTASEDGIAILKRSSCAFVTFEHAASARAAIESSPILVAGYSLEVEERRSLKATVPS